MKQLTRILDQFKPELIKLYKMPDGNYNVITPDILNKKVRKIFYLIEKELFFLGMIDKMIEQQQTIDLLRKENNKLIEQDYNKHKLIEELENELNEAGY
jgi:hypothetical protein